MDTPQFSPLKKRWLHISIDMAYSKLADNVLVADGENDNFFLADLYKYLEVEVEN